MTNAIRPELTKVGFEQTYRTEYKRRGIKGIVEWWVKIREDKFGDKILVINTAEKYDAIILNGRKLEENKIIIWNIQ